MIKVTGLWVNESKEGSKYFSGSVGGLKVLIFKNTFKEGDTDPDYTMFFDENKKREVPKLENDDDVPF